MPQVRKHATGGERQRAYRQRLQKGFGATLKTELPAASAIPSSARWKAISREAQGLLTKLQTEMVDYQAERSERWLESSRGEEFQERLDQLSEILDILGAMD